MLCVLVIFECIRRVFIGDWSDVVRDRVLFLEKPTVQVAVGL